MSELEQVVILVKAWPQPSLKYGETVCCAGVTLNGEWRRLFPIRFRHLSGDAQFKRWDVIEYRSEPPKDDRRSESRHVHENSLAPQGVLAKSSRERLLSPLIRASIKDAAETGESLTLIRPKNVKFICRQKRESELIREQDHRKNRAAQGSLLDRELNALETCPYHLYLRFEDGTGSHRMECADWETAAAYFKFSKDYGPSKALDLLRETYEVTYPLRGVVFALGTQKKRPKQWLLLGIIRLDESQQLQLI